MNELREIGLDLVGRIQGFLASCEKQQKALDDRKNALDTFEEGLMNREKAVAGIEVADLSRRNDETRKEELLKAQQDVYNTTAELKRQQEAFAKEKTQWEDQKQADQRSIDNERAELRKVEANLAKEKAEYKDKIMAKIKAGV